MFHKLTNVEALRYAVRGYATRRRGEDSPVSQSCQIPGLRDIYETCSLSANQGVFVEIGGYDGESYSNTSFLADQGWRGLYVEPIAEFARKARIRHAFNRVRVARTAIGPKDGHTTLQMMGPLSTFSDDTIAAYDHIDWAQAEASAAQPRRVTVRRLETVLQRYRVPHAFDILVVDVEGSEESIVEQLFETPWRPKVIIIELVDIHDSFASFREVHDSARRTREMIAAKGYQTVSKNPINTVFLSGDNGT